MTAPVVRDDRGGGRRVRLTREQRRASLVDAAARLVATGGARTVTMERVAAEAGVTKAVPYAHYENAGELLADLFEREADELSTRVAEAVERCDGFEEKVKATVTTWFDYAMERGPLLQVLFSTDVPEPMAARRAARTEADRRLWVEFIMAEAEIDRPTATVAATVLFTGGASLLELWIAKVLPRRELVERFGTMATGAIAALREGSKEAR